MKTFLNALAFLGAGYAALALTVFIAQRSMLYFPSKDASKGGGLQAWHHEGEIIGFCRPAEQPGRVWLMLHGNAGQAAQRSYALALVGPRDAFYVLEYPGFGLRSGRPSRTSIDAAAREAYGALRSLYPNSRIGLIGESLGSGAACMLAAEATPPDAIVLANPFDRLGSVAARHMPWLPARWLLRDNWDNIAALTGYEGALVIMASAADTTIPPSHGRALADSHPKVQWISLRGDHNDWSLDPAATEAIRSL